MPRKQPPQWRRAIIAELLRRRRTGESPATRHALAIAIKVTPSTVYRALQDDGNPSAAIIDRMLTALGLEVRRG